MSFYLDLHITCLFDKERHTSKKYPTYYIYQIKLGKCYRHIIKIVFLLFLFYLLFYGSVKDIFFASMWLALYFLVVANYVFLFWKNHSQNDFRKP